MFDIYVYGRHITKEHEKNKDIWMEKGEI